MIKTFDQWVEGSQDAQQFDLTQELQKALEDALAKGDQATADKYQKMSTQMAQRQQQPKSPRQPVKPPLLPQTRRKYIAPDPSDFPIGWKVVRINLPPLPNNKSEVMPKTKQGWLAKLKGLFGG